jgi:hypothetical protein
MWDTRSLPPGRYSLRLTTTDQAPDGTLTASIARDTVTVGRMGDVDADGAMTVQDAAATLEASAGLLVFTPEGLALADVYPRAGEGARSHGDGRATVGDALAIVRAADVSMDNAANGRLH